MWPSSEQRLLQNGLQPVAESGRFLLAFLQLSEEYGGVAVVLLDGVGVLEVEVVVACFDLVDRHLPGDVVSLAPLPAGASPPIGTGLEVLEADGSGHRVSLLPLGDAVLVEPDLLRLRSLLEEEEVRADGGVGFEDAVRQADDGVEVALRKQVLFQAGFDAFAEEGAVGQDHGGAALGPEQADDEGQEQIGRLSGLEVLREVGLDAVFLAPAEGGIGEDDVHPVGFAVADVGPGQRVVVADEGGVVDAVEEHVGDAEHVGELLFLGGAEP